jgi:hypothetical protein
MRKIIAIGLLLLSILVIPSQTYANHPPTESKVLYRGIGNSYINDIKTDNAGNVYVLYNRYIQKYTPDGKGVFKELYAEPISYVNYYRKPVFADSTDLIGDALYCDGNNMYILAFFDEAEKFNIYKLTENLDLELATDCTVETAGAIKTSLINGRDFLTKLEDGQWFFSSCEGVASSMYYLYTPDTYYKRLPVNAEQGDIEVVVDGEKVYLLSSLTGELIYYDLNNDEVKWVATAPIASDTKIASHGKAFYFSYNGSILKISLNGRVTEYISKSTMKLYDNKLGANDDFCLDENNNLIYTDRGFLRMKY